MADKRENEMQVVDNIDYLRAVKGVNSGLISVESAIKNNTLINVGTLSRDITLDEVENSFGYALNSVDDTGVNGPFISFGVKGYQIQLKSDYLGTSLFFRIIQNNSSTSWKRISFTK